MSFENGKQSFIKSEQLIRIGKYQNTYSDTVNCFP